MKDEQNISSKQIKALVVTTLIGIGILNLPSDLVIIQGNDGWLPIIITGLLIIPFLIVINKIFELYPDRDFFEIGEEILGKWIFNIYLIIFLFHFIIATANVSRHLGELIKAFLLITTPIEVIIISFIIVTSYLSRSKLNVIGRASYHIYPIILGYIIVLTLVMIIDIDFTNILPVFQSNIRDIPKSISMAFPSFTGFEVLLFFLPFAEDRNKTLKSMLKGLTIVIIIYLIIFLLALSQFGVKHLQRQTFPTLFMIKEVDFPGFFIENLDGLVIGIWVLITFITLAVDYFAAGKILSHLTKTKSHDLFILPLLPIIYVISIIPSNIVMLDQILGKVSDYISIIVVFVMPVIIYLIGYFKVRRAKN